MPRDGDVVMVVDLLRLHLVHRERGGEDARSREREAEEREESLHGAILAAGAMERDEDDVRALLAAQSGDARRFMVQCRGGRTRVRPARPFDAAGSAAVSIRLQRSRLGRLADQPRAVAADLDRDGLVARAIERREHLQAARDRHVMLAALAAHEDGDADLPGGLAHALPSWIDPPSWPAGSVATYASTSRLT